MLAVGRMRLVRPALVIEIVHQPRQSPRLHVFAEPFSVRPHRPFNGEHVLSQRVAGGVLVHQLERLGTG